MARSASTMLAPPRLRAIHCTALPKIIVTLRFAPRWKTAQKLHIRGIASGEPWQPSSQRRFKIPSLRIDLTASAREMNRRTFITGSTSAGLLAGAAGWSRGAAVQQPDMPVIGLLD